LTPLHSLATLARQTLGAALHLPLSDSKQQPSAQQLFSIASLAQVILDAHQIATQEAAIVDVLKQQHKDQQPNLDAHLVI
jgi:hypothetical protein